MKGFHRVAVTEDRDRGEKEIKRAFKKLKGSFVTVGVHDGTGEYPNGVAVSQVAFWNEFGTKNIPQRSFIRSTVDENAQLFNSEIKRIQGQVLSLKITPAAGLRKLGRRVQEAIKKKILTGPFEPNAPSTLAGKDGTKPLIDTKLLLRSINFEVNMR